MASQPDPQQAEPEPEPNSTIIYPTVPAHEEDPAARINVMKAIFNNTLQDLGKSEKPDTGFAHEIMTAEYVLDKILHFDKTALRGCHISRPLIIREIAEGLKGHAQFVRVPLGQKHLYRELDMVFFDSRPGADGILTIVEAKSTKFVDHHQMRLNVLLARRLGGKVMYSVDRPGQKKTLQAAYSAIPESHDLPPLEVIVPLDEYGRFVDQWKEDVRRGGGMSFARTYTEEDKRRTYWIERPELYYPMNTEEGTRYEYISDG